MLGLRQTRSRSSFDTTSQVWNGWGMTRLPTVSHMVGAGQKPREKPMKSDVASSVSGSSSGLSDISSGKLL